MASQGDNLIESFALLARIIALIKQPDPFNKGRYNCALCDFNWDTHRPKCRMIATLADYEALKAVVKS